MATKIRTKEINDALVYVKGGRTTASKIVVFTIWHDDPYSKIKKFKFSYLSGNAYEEFSIKQYDGLKLECIADLNDLGVRPDASAYNLLNEHEHKQRIEMLMLKAIEYITNLLS